MIGDDYIIGADMAAPGSDYSVVTVWRRPGRLRRLLRKLGIDRSQWEFKIVRQEEL